MKWDSAGEMSNSSQSKRSVSLNSLEVGGKKNPQTRCAVYSILCVCEIYPFSTLTLMGCVSILAVATENLLDIDEYSSAVEIVDNPTEPNNNSTTLWVRSCPCTLAFLLNDSQGGFYMSDC